MKALKNSIYLLVVAGFLSSCSSTPTKHVPVVYTVQIKDMKFMPEDITVDKGDTIMWTNMDMTVHDVTSATGKWTSGPIAADKTWKMAVTDSASYICNIHKVMKGHISLE